MQLTGVLVLSMLLLYQLMFHVDPKKRPLNIALQRIYSTLGSRNQLTNAHMLEGMLDCFASDYYKFLHPDTILEDRYCFIPEGLEFESPDCFRINPAESPNIFQFRGGLFVSKIGGYVVPQAYYSYLCLLSQSTAKRFPGIVYRQLSISQLVETENQRLKLPKCKYALDNYMLQLRIRSLSSLYSMRDYLLKHFSRKVNLLNYTHYFIYPNETAERIGKYNYKIHLQLIQNDSTVHMNGLLIRQPINPFLINKRKFYFRVYVIQVQRQIPKILYLHQIVRIIPCQKPFTTQTPEAFICDGFPIQSLTFEELNQYLNRKLPFLQNFGIKEDIRKQMMNQISYAFRVQEPRPNEPRQFEVYKFDFNFGGNGRIGIIDYNLMGPDEIFFSMGKTFKDSLRRLMNLYFRQRYQTIKNYIFQKMIPQIMENSEQENDNNAAYLRLQPISKEQIPTNLIEISYLSEISQCFRLDQSKF